MKIDLQKINDQWVIDTDLPEEDSTQQKIKNSVELLSFLHANPDLFNLAVMEINEQYGSDVASESVSILSRAMGIADPDNSSESSENIILAEMPVTDAVFIEVK